MTSVLQTLVAFLMCWFVASSLWIYPHSLSYFNESIGGPLNGAEHLLGSNVDWGQDVRYFREWVGLKRDVRTSRPLRLGYCLKCSLDSATLRSVLSANFPSDDWSGEDSRPVTFSSVFLESEIADLQQIGPASEWYAVSVSKLFEPHGGGESPVTFRHSSSSLTLRDKLKIAGATDYIGMSIRLYCVSE